MLLRPATLGLSSYGISESTNAHATLPVPCKCVLSCKTGTTGALVGLVASVDLCVTLEIVLPHKALAASIALELPVAKMCLDVRADVFSSAEDLAAILIQACPLVCLGVLFADVSLDFFGSDAGVLKARIDLKVCVEWRFFEWADSERQTIGDAVCGAVRFQGRKKCGWVREGSLLNRVLGDALEEGLCHPHTWRRLR